MKIVKEPINKDELREIAKAGFGNVVKAVVDIRFGVMAVGGELHADEEVSLVEHEGSERENTWGINLYTEKSGDEFIEFNSMVNIKPAFGNRSREVENLAVREQITTIVHKLIKP
ncbi:hypothetical protein A2661_00265 [Candidatus Giovannonibacteria bacterium RIFCSPHIGHO2_01_FULL_45_24]|uniref:Uncharacterized protein n=1 Tax=Candidatus Giovannonibacteria bacterium RIFCSPLOWO2_01_FULL_46_32 TaxID=1798353 RepID=A0A1F5XGX5_9BACT|nr:MAG: hypothetical protein A2661_00265 [Candidatus Giovannonibacteria bacterium RIFCSPHIGHO2_01_FULL_45_24]OGF87117.1 MAG: hypothetical protein A3B19_01105 [Candidatus Giovannonibacteria bacterium RIFCSPLOWO2_01_FULL_46_32]